MDANIPNKIPVNRLWDQASYSDSHLLQNPFASFHPFNYQASSTASQFQNVQGNQKVEEVADAEEDEELGAMKEMVYRIAAMQPVDIDPASIRKPRRRNVRISDDPQSVAARHRRERISEKIRILQRLVPGGTKMDTASMLDEAIRYVKFLKRQVRLLQANPYPPSYLPGDQHWQPIPAGGKHLGSTSSSISIGEYNFGIKEVENLCFAHEVIND